MKVWIGVVSLLFSLSLYGSSPIRVEISAKGAILMNAETGAVLWEKNAHTPYFPASITKMITALYAFEKQGDALDKMVTASHDAVSVVPAHVRQATHGGHPPYRLEFGGTHIGIKVGEILPFRALLYGLMLGSGNDAANVIAEHVSGDVSTFIEELNRYVVEKGCRNTVLRAPHGLYHEEHKTTAFDIALLARELLKHDFLREVVKTVRYPRPQTNKQPESMIHQHNALLRPGKFFYPKAIGIKTGYIAASKYTLVAAAEDENRTLIAVVLGCETKEQRYQDAIALFEAGFNEKKVSRTLFSKGFDVFYHEVLGGNAPLQASLSRDMVLDYYPSEEPSIKTSIIWQPLELPVRMGQKVAEIHLLSSTGREMASAPLYALSNVDATWGYEMQKMGSKIKKYFRGRMAIAMTLAGLLILGGTFYYARPGRGQ